MADGEEKPRPRRPPVRVEDFGKTVKLTFMLRELEKGNTAINQKGNNIIYLEPYNSVNKDKDDKDKDKPATAFISFEMKAVLNKGKEGKEAEYFLNIAKLPCPVLRDGMIEKICKGRYEVTLFKEDPNINWRDKMASRPGLDQASSSDDD